ncbi:unnamed protein product [Meloidogyne enterolobii]|uniref:Uncharacterized protein n=1 Tax=Meloidogyne enterolobii TaxID=390850 RepID=A0ACB0ZKG2_MELEN
MDREPRLLRSARPFVPMAVHPTSSEDDNAMLQMMCDLMLDEIQTQIDRVQKEAEQRRQEELRLTKMPDYTWLIDWRLRAKRPLGYREWRRRVRYVDSRDEILNVFRQTVEWVISERMENECRIECVNEHEIHGRTVTNTRPTTAQPLIPLRELSVFALTSPPLPGEGTV